MDEQPDEPAGPVHGTYKQYQAERNAGGPVCRACQQAATDYQRDWRRRTGNASGRTYNRLRHRALMALKDRHRAEYERIFRQLRNQERTTHDDD